MPGLKTTYDFIQDAIAVHGNRYDYSEATYTGCKNKIKITCKSHGVFEQDPSNHLAGKGCRMCSIEKNAKERYKGTNGFIQEAIKVHGDKYDYSLTKYKGSRKRLRIACKDHGVFFQLAGSHLSGKGCRKCAWNQVSELHKKTTKEFVAKSHLVHGKKYCYKKSNYISAVDKVVITCPDHGDFKQKPDHHTRGHGCPKCVGRNRTTSEFISIAKVIHGNQYSYEKAIYSGVDQEVLITCKKHGDFKQRAAAHISSSNPNGCPKCGLVFSKGERKIKRFLDNQKIDYQRQKPIKGLRHKKPLRFDFYLPKYKCAIEYNGQQHYAPVSVFGGEAAFRKTQKRDAIKRRFCKENSISLIEVRYDENIREALESKLPALLN